jgi:predicted HicB family RNase H-like nuclease
MDILKYKGYEGTTEIDMDRQVCHGKILFIDDVVTFSATSPVELKKEFEAAVDDYIETCATLKRDPQMPLRGQFNVRIPPALHKSAARRALTDNISLNEVVVRALNEFVTIPTEANHSAPAEIIDILKKSMETLVSSVSAQPQWKAHNVTTH